MAEINSFLSDKAEKQIEQYKKDIKELNEEYKKLGKIVVDYEKQLREQSKTQQQLIKQQEQLEKLNQQIAKTDAENLKAQQQLNKVLQEEEKIAQQRLKTEQEREKRRQQSIKTKKLDEKATKKQTQAQKTLLQEYKQEIKTAKQATEQNKRLRDMRNKLDITAKNYSKRLDTINKLINRNNKLTASQADADKKRTLGIGKYAESLQGVNVRLDSVIDGVKGLAGQFKKLLLNPAILAITALIGALTLLGKAFKNNRQFQETWTKSMSAARAEWNAFSNSLTSGDFRTTWKNLRQIGETAFALSEEFIRITREAAIFATKIAGSTAQLERFRTAADDNTLSFQERSQAAEKAFEVEGKINEKQIELAEKVARNYIKQLRNQYGQDLTLAELKETIKQEELQQLTELQTAYINALNKRRQDELNYDKFKRELRLDDFEQELDFIFDVADKRKTANEKIIADDRIAFNERKMLFEETTQLLDDSFKDQINLFNEFNDVNIDTNKLIGLNNKESFEYARSLGMSERATNRLLEVIRERIAAESDLLELQKDLREEETKISTEITSKRIDSEQELTLELTDELKKRYNANKAYLDKIDSDTEMSVEKRKELQQQLTAELTNIGNLAFSLQQSRLDSELDALQTNYDARINAAEGNNEIQEALARELAQKQYEIQLQQAKSEKNQALFNIAISTAQGVAKALQTSGVAGIALGALITASGLAQAAIVANQPLPSPPQFATGTDYSPSTFIAGEAGRELMITKDGNAFLTPNSASLYTGMEGTQIIPNSQTEAILAATNQHAAGAINDSQLSNKLDAVVDAIERNKVNVNLDKRGVWNYSQGRSKFTQRKNRLLHN